MHWAALVLVLGAVSSHLADGGYIFTAPKILRSETDALFRLTLTDVKEDGKVTVRLLKYNNDSVVLAEQEYDIKNGEGAFLPFRVPEHLDSQAKIEVNGTFGSYVFGDRKEIDFQKSKNTILVQSDKALYKPGQKVQFRVLPINNELKPVTDVKATIYVTSPSDVRIAQWNDVSFEKGIVQRDFQLTEEPELGLWQIVVELPTQTVRQHFEVNEYVLPKFEITIKPPSYVLADAKEITWKICAHYTFGQPVDGTLTVNVTYERYSWEKDDYPKINHTGPINGCYDMTVNTTLLRFNENYEIYKRISFVAQVNETGTGVTMNKTNFISRSFNPLELNFLEGEHGKNYFKPTMPFYGRLLVKKPDGVPVGGELVQLCLLSQSEEIKPRWWRTDRRLSCKNYTSDESGIIKFTIPPLKASVVTISVEAVAMNYETVKYDTYGVKINQPKSTLYLQAWYSASNNFIQVEPSKGPIPCTGKYSVRLRYTGEPDTQKQFHFQVMARGKILKDKVEDVAFKPDEAVPVDASFLVEEDLNETLPSNMAEGSVSTGSFEFELEPDFSYVPRVKVLAFYIRPDGEVIADAEQFEVEKCLQNNVTMRFGSETVQPATSAAIHVNGSPRSYCGVGVVDKSVHLLKQDNQLTKDKVYDILKRLDITRYTWPKQASYDYCRKQLAKNPQQYKRNIWNGPRSSNVEYVDSITAFDESGVVVMSDLTLETRPCRKNIYDRPPYALAAPASALDAEEFDGDVVQLYSAVLRSSGGRQRVPAPRPLAFAAGPPPPPSAVGFSNRVVGGLPGVPVALDSVAQSAPSANIPAKSAVEVRTYFPETWLWELKELDEHGELSFKEKIPHTITEWVGSTVCINSEDGIGVSDPAKIKAFQPFFASFNLPYSVVRGELVPVKVSVFNYLEKCLPVDLKLAESADYHIEGESETTLCVCGSKSQVHKFQIRPQTIGEVNLTVSAAGSQSDTACGEQPTEKVVARDAVTRPLIIEAEGFEKEETQSVFVCPKDAGEGGAKNEFDLVLPEDLVEGSARAYVSVTGDIMGPAIKNLDSLVQVPTGCGEQNMVKFTPNVYVLDYLKATGKDQKEIERKAVNNLKTGYQRQQKYKHYDGSYSAFGNSDSSGSMFLTAFVVKSFKQAEKYMPIDAGNLNESIKWIITKQKTNGCFQNVGTVLSSGLKGKVNSTAPGALTAYVLTALLEGGLADAQVVESALRCISAQRDPSAHNLALSAYAAALAGHESAKEYLEKLESIAVHKGGLTYWSNAGKKGPSVSADVETAAYAVLAYLKLNPQENLNKAQPIVRWMATKRNSRGGFPSTQDTVLGLQALSAFATFVSKDPVDITVKVDGNDVSESYNLKEDTKLVVQEKKVVNLPNKLTSEATGPGCALVSTTLKYNVHTAPKSEGFELTATPSQEASDCNDHKVKICLRYDGEQPSNMAVLELKLVSGYIPDEDHIYSLYREKDVKLKRHEVEKNQVNFYFEEITSENKCFDVRLHREFAIEDAKPATVKVYDYYEQENSNSVPYTLVASC
ncbi:alpha-1-macroglobulin isoform X3 [Dermacentor silvarum]|uniref:alpha-1-macroglobulin isoform X3 n=1 Tax=Dermacentor silvarum TaxID=543639 RepID=UPI001896E3D5|nr:alpha-1-macroglobulin isoform X3 [Dermacentor silvarum]